MPRWLLVALLLPSVLPAQDLAAVLARLEKLEAENVSLRQEVKHLREVVEGKPSLPERVEIAERRIDEQAATKVETPGKFPLELTGTLLFQAFYNTRGNNGTDVGTTAGAIPGRAIGGASMRQSIIGLRYHGPVVFGSGKVSGSLMMDFWDGNSEGGTTPFRIRTGDISIDWTKRSVSVGLMSPLISPYTPSSLAYLGVAALTSSGNLWRWQPQVRYEERSQWWKAQAAILQTNEDVTGAPANLLNSRRRPSLELRGALTHTFSGERRLEAGFSGHFSESRLNGQSLPSRIGSFDWLFMPFPQLTVNGTYFRGQNVHHLGALRQSFRLLPNGTFGTVHSTGGWTQASWAATNRLTVNLFAGIHDDRNADLARGQNAANRTGGGNIMLRLAPNVVLSFESMQVRSTYLGTLQRRFNRYDLAIAYLF